jgi:tRNA pseudouridine(55) synthase
LYLLTTKLLGQTPLEALELLRREKNIDVSVPMTYAGRLDPMAEGLLLILVGDECKKKDEYLGLDKEYEVEVLLGVGSDTGDVLGVVEGLKIKGDLFSIEIIKEKIKLLVGKRFEKYPPYSSKTVAGKPLFEYANEGTIDDIQIPTKEIEIYSIDFLGTDIISLNELVPEVIERIKLVKGDFRQGYVIDSWENLFRSETNNINLEDSFSTEEKSSAFRGGASMQAHSQTSFQIVKLRISCSSGSYMRTLAEKLGAMLGVPALAWKIKRTQIGEYVLS